MPGISGVARLWRTVKIAMGVAFAAMSLMIVWDLVFPPDENALYVAHFVEIAQRPLPPSAKIVYRESNVMNIQGRSWVRSRFELAPVDYAALLAAMRKDSSLKVIDGQPGHFSRPPSGEIKFARTLEFLDDGKSIDVEQSN